MPGAFLPIIMPTMAEKKKLKNLCLSTGVKWQIKAPTVSGRHMKKEMTTSLPTAARLLTAIVMRGAAHPLTL